MTKCFYAHQAYDSDVPCAFNEIIDGVLSHLSKNCHKTEPNKETQWKGHANNAMADDDHTKKVSRCVASSS